MSAKSSFINNAMENKPRIIFATNNQHKLVEIQSAIGDKLEIISLKAAGIDIDIPEPHETIEENATEKSTTIHKLTGGENVFSEDTGLEIDALNGEPGVHTAYYGGEERSAEKNNAKVLQRLGDNPNRKARFRTIISLIYNNTEHLFEGITEGHIGKAPEGTLGFGYDPIFVPDGETRPFGQMTLEEKNRFSHRRKAADQLVTFLQTQI